MRQALWLAYDAPAEYPLVHRWPLALRIRLEGDALRYDAFPRNLKALRWAPKPSVRLLLDFAALADRPPVEIERYAKKWGCLALCRHGFPTGIFYGFHTDKDPHGVDVKFCPATGCEPLTFWRFWAGSFRALLNLSGGQSGAQDWRALGWRGRRDKAHLADIANRVAVRFGHLRPVVVPTGKNGFGLRTAGSLYGAGLAAALSYQLLAMIAAGKNLLVCAGCGKWFESRARRGMGRDAFCESCGRTAATRSASNRYYQRHRQEIATRRREKRSGAKTQRG
jgi:hypothetical protein